MRRSVPVPPKGVPGAGGQKDERQRVRNEVCFLSIRRPEKMGNGHDSRTEEMSGAGQSGASVRLNFPCVLQRFCPMINEIALVD